jgi:hypothetical protein
MGKYLVSRIKRLAIHSSAPITDKHNFICDVVSGGLKTTIIKSELIIISNISSRKSIL